MSGGVALAELRKRRRNRRLAAVLRVFSVLSLLTASFSMGSLFGPAPVRPKEMLMLVALSAAAAVVAGGLWARWRWLGTARLRLRLQESGRPVRIRVFSEYLELRREWVPLGAIERSEVTGSTWTLRYSDPRLHRPVLRVLEGAAPSLQKLGELMDELMGQVPTKGSSQGATETR